MSPLSNLDAKLRAQMRIELAKLHKELETTIIYVTHDQTEAMTLGTRIVVMKDGSCSRWKRRSNFITILPICFVAGFIGSPAMNFFQAEVAEEAGEIVVYIGDRNSGRKVKLNGYRAEMAKLKALNRKVTLGIRPEDIYTEEEAAEKGFEKATEGMTEIITARELLGAEVFLYFDEQGRSHTARMKPENKTRTGEVSACILTRSGSIFLTVTRKKICFMQRRCDHEYPEEKVKYHTIFLSYTMYAGVCGIPLLSVFKTIFLSLFLTDKMGQAKIFVGLQNYMDLLASSLSATV